MTPQAITYAVAAVAVLIVLFFRLRGLKRGRPLRLERLWIVPTLYGIFAAGLFWWRPPHGVQWLWAAAALLLGSAIGWWRGKLMRIEIDPVSHALNQRQSPAALLLIVGLIGMRFVLREELGATGTMPAAGVIDAFVAFAVGLLAMQRVEMFLRARRMLAEARGAA
ncbi:CcdC protein domain-containing protein [Glacieibacterium frigidum]|uniref:DUF1453 family protein n=1 Tax=Glacieibacterium frigidum TaxID=2593303 RepID=A0A552UFD5_9SPHN|nr:CcdC protein domain-containing protein [Glacieibacterium frigidum]TRW16932.1 DUF1453 family protein [Glacieibacterium frigidum]